MARTQLSVHRLLLFILLLLFTWIFTSLAWDLHNGMRTHKADLGQIAQAVWNSSQGRFVEMTDNGPLSSRLTDHVEPILMVISPVLWLWRDVRMLLLLQVLTAAIGGWLLYELAVIRFATLLSLKSRTQIWLSEPLLALTSPVALALALGLFLSPEIQNALLTEFHAAPLAVPLILWSFYAVEKLASSNAQKEPRYWIHFVVATLLVASVKEEMALLAAGLGAWALYKLAIEAWLASLLSTVAKGIAAKGIAAKFGVQYQSNEGNLHITPSASHPFTQKSRFVIPLAVTLLSLLWFYLTTFVIVPAHAAEVYNNAENPYWARYGALGDSPADIVKSLFTQPLVVLQIASEPVRVNYLWSMLASFGFLSLLAPEILLLSLPLLLANLLSEYPPQYYGEFHYSAPLVAYFGMSAVYGAKRLGRLGMALSNTSSASYQHMPAASSWMMALVALARNSGTTLRPLFFGGLVLWLLGWNIVGYLENGRGPWGGRFDPTSVNNHHRTLDRFIAQLPPNAAVTATAAVHPHVALRRFVYQFPIGMPEFGEQGDADWALIDVTTSTDMAPGDLRDRVRQMLDSDWGVVDGADGFLLLRQGESDEAPSPPLSKQIPPAFFNFARLNLDGTETSTSLTGSVDASIRPLSLVGIHADDRARWRTTKVMAQWQVGPDFDPERDAPKLSILTPAGKQLHSYSDGTPTALIWYPPSEWQEGDVVSVTTGALSLQRVWGIAIPKNAAPEENALLTDGSMALIASYRRDDRNILVDMPLPTASAQINFMDFALGNSRVNTSTQRRSYRFDTEWLTQVESALLLAADYEMRRTQSGDSVDLIMRWTGDGLTQWPEGLSPFVHLRKPLADGGAENLTQQDGMPRWFLVYDSGSLIAEGKALWDWRQLEIPRTETEGEKAGFAAPVDRVPVVSSAVISPGIPDTRLVAGLYDPQSGGRAELLDEMGNPAGNEAMVGSFAPPELPAPDFACAMNRAACSSQMQR